MDHLRGSERDARSRNLVHAPQECAAALEFVVCGLDSVASLAGWLVVIAAVFAQKQSV